MRKFIAKTDLPSQSSPELLDEMEDPSRYSARQALPTFSPPIIRILSLFSAAGFPYIQKPQLEYQIS